MTPRVLLLASLTTAATATLAATSIAHAMPSAAARAGTAAAAPTAARTATTAKAPSPKPAPTLWKTPEEAARAGAVNAFNNDRDTGDKFGPMNPSRVIVIKHDRYSSFPKDSALDYTVSTRASFHDRYQSLDPSTGKPYRFVMQTIIPIKAVKDNDGRTGYRPVLRPRMTDQGFVSGTVFTPLRERVHKEDWVKLPSRAEIRAERTAFIREMRARGMDERYAKSLAQYPPQMRRAVMRSNDVTFSHQGSSWPTGGDY